MCRRLVVNDAKVIELARKALNATDPMLDDVYQKLEQGDGSAYMLERWNVAKAGVRESLAASEPGPEPMPLAWLYFDNDGRKHLTCGRTRKDSTPLYPQPTAYRTPVAAQVSEDNSFGAQLDGELYENRRAQPQQVGEDMVTRLIDRLNALRWRVNPGSKQSRADVREALEAALQVGLVVDDEMVKRGVEAYMLAWDKHEESGTDKPMPFHILVRAALIAVLDRQVKP
jgi:hypothetical protein